MLGKTSSIFSKNKHLEYVKEESIIKEINSIKKEIDSIRKNLNLVTDEYLIDSYIYELTSLNKRYQYFLKEAKSNGITAFKMEG